MLWHWIANVFLFLLSLFFCFVFYFSSLVVFSSGGSMFNVYAEEDGESSTAAQQSLENSITMTKMKLLKAKMEDMNLNKKVGTFEIKENQWHFVICLTYFIRLRHDTVYAEVNI